MQINYSLLAHLQVAGFQEFDYIYRKGDYNLFDCFPQQNVNVHNLFS